MIIRIRYCRGILIFSEVSLDRIGRADGDVYGEAVPREKGKIVD